MSCQTLPTEISSKRFGEGTNSKAIKGQMRRKEVQWVMSRRMVVKKNTGTKGKKIQGHYISKGEFC